MSRFVKASNHGISTNKDENAFFAGRIKDILILEYGNFPKLCASDSSGVWFVDDIGGYVAPLSENWVKPKVNSLSKGILGSNHFFAGGDMLRETNSLSFAPLLDWNPISIVNKKLVPIVVGEIFDIIITENSPQKVIIATEKGIFWSNGPISGNTYVFEQALTGAFTGLALGINNTIIAAAKGTAPLGKFGLFHGTWNSSKLVFTKSIIDPTVIQNEFNFAVVDSCASNKNILYSIGSIYSPDDNQEGFCKYILKSTDSGLNWMAVNNKIITDTETNTIQEKLGSLQHGKPGNAHNLCISVSPFDPNLVIIGLVQAAITNNGGDGNWRLLMNNNHRHQDITSIAFSKQIRVNKNEFYFSSDGSLCFSSDLGISYSSTGNKKLSNLLFNKLSVSRSQDGLIAGSTQDNGNIYNYLYGDAYLSPTERSWIYFGFEGDGSFVVFLTQSTGEVPVLEIGNQGVPIQIYNWDLKKRQLIAINQSPIFDKYKEKDLNYKCVIPIKGEDDGLFPSLIEEVIYPKWSNELGEKLLCIGSRDKVIFGLFSSKIGSYYWQSLFQVDIDIADKLSAISSYDGNRIFIGTEQQRLFFFETNLFKVWVGNEFSMAFFPSTLPRNRVKDFAVFDDKQVFYITDDVRGNVKFIGDGNIFYFDGFTGHKTITGLLSGSSFQSIEAKHSSFSTDVYVAIENNVFRSTDFGNTWNDISLGLPTSANCKDLKYLKEKSGAEFLYLATYGWSIYRNLLNVNPIVSNILISGSIDTDNIDFGVTSSYHYPFKANLQIGPYASYKEITFHNEGTDEIYVNAKFHFQWWLEPTFHISFWCEATMEANSQIENSSSTPVVFIELNSPPYSSGFFMEHKISIDVILGEVDTNIDRATIVFTIEFKDILPL